MNQVSHRRLHEHRLTKGDSVYEIIGHRNFHPKSLNNGFYGCGFLTTIIRYFYNAGINICGMLSPKYSVVTLPQKCGHYSNVKLRSNYNLHALIM